MDELQTPNPADEKQLRIATNPWRKGAVDEVKEWRRTQRGGGLRGPS